MKRLKLGIAIVLAVSASLRLWQGSYHGEDRMWLRWHDTYGKWIPTDAEQAQSRTEQIEQVAEQERQRAGRLAELLR
jgi:hypothetical protein